MAILLEIIDGALWDEAVVLWSRDANEGRRERSVWTLSGGGGGALSSGREYGSYKGDPGIAGNPRCGEPLAFWGELDGLAILSTTGGLTLRTELCLDNDEPPVGWAMIGLPVCLEKVDPPVC